MPSAEIGALRVSLGLDSAQFSTGLKQSQGRLATFGKSMAIAAVGAIASFVSIRGAINETRAALEHFGKINDLSVGAGIDSDAFQGLAHAASLAGVSMEQAGSAFAVFAKNSGLAEAGTGRMAAAFGKLNPELLAGIRNAGDQETRLKLVANALSQIPDPAQRAALATAAFGEAGIKLAEVFRGGATSVDEFIAKAKDMGLVVDRELISRADELGDKFDTASQIVDTKLKVAFVNAAPALVWLADRAADFATSIGLVVDHFQAIEDRTLLNPLKVQMAETVNLIEEMRGQLDALNAGPQIPFFTDDARKRLESRIDEQINTALRVQQRMKELQSSQTPLALPPVLPVLPPLPSDTIDRSKAIADSIDQMNAGLELQRERWAELVAPIRETFDTIGAGVSGALSDLIKVGIRGGDVIGAVTDRFSQLGDRLIEMGTNALIERGAQMLLGAFLGAGAGVGHGLTGAMTYGGGGIGGYGLPSDWKVPTHAAGGSSRVA